MNWRVGALIVVATLQPLPAVAQRPEPLPFTDGKLLLQSGARAITAPGRWTRRDLLLLPVAAAGIALLSTADESGRSFMQRHQSSVLDDVFELVEPLGTVDNYKVLAGIYVAGLLSGNDKARAVAAEGIASSVVAGALITPAIQKITGRSRPSTHRSTRSFDAFSGNVSFPSGHTTQAFAVASVIATEYDAAWVRAASYGLASLVGLSRMYEDAHYLSDVTTAALIGTLVGRTIVHQRRASEAAAIVKPVLLPYGAAVEVRLEF